MSTDSSDLSHPTPPSRRGISRRSFFKTSLVAGGAVLGGSWLVACSDDNGGIGGKDKNGKDKGSPVDDGAVINDDGSGSDAATQLFGKSDTLAVAPMADQEALDLAAQNHVPVIVVEDPQSPEGKGKIDSTVSALKATHVVLLGGLTRGGVDNKDKKDGAEDNGVTYYEADTEWPKDAPTNDVKDGVSGTALAGPETTPVAKANATGSGFTVLSLLADDPRASSESIEASRSDNKMVGLSQNFGTKEEMAERKELARTVERQQPGGGGLVFPGRHIIALYGHPSGPALGVMGEQDVNAAVERAQEMAAQYNDLVNTPVIPAFEIIATVAAQEPGPDGSYSNYTDPAEIEPWVKAITDAGGYAIIDVQPGMETLLTQVKFYEDLIKLPNVGVALDPEWRLEPGQVPLSQVGHVQVEEINEVVDWLDQLVAKEKGEQKLLMIHQFQLQMIRNRENMSTGTNNVKMLVHCDGHGAPGTKMDTWEVVRAELPPQIALGWKNFIDEDQPMFTPQQTMDVKPTPDFVSYQ